MREHSRDHGRLEDILKYAKNVEQIVNGITYEQFVDDIRIYYSVMKNIEVIGEAANMLTRHFRETHTELPWRLIVSMRNVLVHGYAQVSDADLWQTATNDILPLREQVQRYLSDIDWEQWAQGENPYTEIDNAVYKQAIESARRMKAKGYAVEDIVEITGLTNEEIERL
ncbi:HepT-like ribonuclease domain-containing protein [Prevotella sp. P6B4]|uniref:HepT-like ribonuclease domain-containing protein n=1 Tax=Prevotella sp. P6B4 TaxID=1410614 RepID=UPI00048E5465